MIAEGCLFLIQYSWSGSRSIAKGSQPVKLRSQTLFHKHKKKTYNSECGIYQSMYCVNTIFLI